jgi:hypothetical protein
MDTHTIFGKEKFRSKMAIGTIRTKLFLNIISHYMYLNFKQKKYSAGTSSFLGKFYVKSRDIT